MSKLLHTRESLILSCIKVISEQGIKGFTTREVAKKQGISESTIFKHYKTKNELILAVLEYFSQYDQAIIETLELKKLKPLEAITFFVDSYVTYYENYPEITAITLSYEGLIHDSELSDAVYKIFNRRYNTMLSLVEDAKCQQEIARDIDSKNLTDLIIGLKRFTILRWSLGNNEFPLKEHTMRTLQMLLNVFLLKK